MRGGGRCAGGPGDVRPAAAGAPACPDAAAVEALARRLFEDYKAHLRADGLPVPHEEYDAQPETLRRSCREQARGFWDKAALIGCAVVPVGDAGPAAGAGGRLDRLTGAQVELLARAEHDRWVAERLADGWTRGPTTTPGPRARRASAGARARPPARPARPKARRGACPRTPRAAPPRSPPRAGAPRRRTPGGSWTPAARGAGHRSPRSPGRARPRARSRPPPRHARPRPRVRPASG